MKTGMMVHMCFKKRNLIRGSQRELEMVLIISEAVKRHLRDCLEPVCPEGTGTVQEYQIKWGKDITNKYLTMLSSRIWRMCNCTSLPAFKGWRFISFGKLHDYFEVLIYPNFQFLQSHDPCVAAVEPWLPEKQQIPPHIRLGVKKLTLAGHSGCFGFLRFKRNVCLQQKNWGKG